MLFWDLAPPTLQNSGIFHNSTRPHLHSDHYRYVYGSNHYRYVHIVIRHFFQLAPSLQSAYLNHLSLPFLTKLTVSWLQFNYNIRVNLV